MSRKKKKIVINILILAIILIGIFSIIRLSTAERRVVLATESNDKSNGKNINDVVSAISNNDYQSITSLKEADSSIGYIIIDSKNSNLDELMPKIINTANSLGLKLTFIDNEEIQNKNNNYYKMIEENGHTVLPNYLDVQEILNKNNVNVINSESDINNLKKQDIAFYISLNDKDSYKDLESQVVSLKEKGYTFKALT